MGFCGQIVTTDFLAHKECPFVQSNKTFYLILGAVECVCICVDRREWMSREDGHLLFEVLNWFF